MNNPNVYTLMNKKCTNIDCPVCVGKQTGNQVDAYSTYSASRSPQSAISLVSLEAIINEVMKNSDYLASQLHIMQLKIDELEYEKKQLLKLKK